MIVMNFHRMNNNRFTRKHNLGCTVLLYRKSDYYEVRKLKFYPIKYWNILKIELCLH